MLDHSTSCSLDGLLLVHLLHQDRPDPRSLLTSIKMTPHGPVRGVLCPVVYQPGTPGVLYTYPDLSQHISVQTDLVDRNIIYHSLNFSQPRYNFRYRANATKTNIFIFRLKAFQEMLQYMRNKSGREAVVFSILASFRSALVCYHHRYA